MLACPAVWLTPDQFQATVARTGSGWPRSEADLELKEQIRQKFIGQSSSLNTFFGFDMDAVRANDAPGTSAPSPLGLRASEFIQLVKYAASLANTRIIEFTEVNPKYDIDDRTTRLVAIGMHRFCTGVA